MRFAARSIAAGGLLIVMAAMAGCSGATANAPTTTELVTLTVSPSVVEPPPTTQASSEPITTTSSPTEPPTSAPSSISPEEAADRAAVEAQWIRFWEVYQAIVRTPPEDRRDQAESVATPELAEKMVAGAEKASSESKDNFGQVIHHVFWQFEIAGEDDAVIADCLDQSNAGILDTSSGATLTTGPQRNNVRGEMHRGSDGIWRVDAVVLVTSNTC